MEKAKSLKSAWIMLTNQCNLKCSYCWLTSRIKNKKEVVMDLNTATRAVDYLNSVGEDGVHISFFGGEPLLEFETIKGVIGKYPYLNYGLYTNTILLTNEKLDYLYEHRDFIRVILSIDGLQSTNLKWRGCNYDESIARRVFRDFPTSMARFTVLDPKTLFDGVKYLHSLGAPKITVNTPHFVNLTADYYKSFDEEVGRIKGDFRLNSITSLSDCRIRSFCHAGIDFMAVSPDGGLYPCDLFYWFDKNRLGDIWNGVDEKALKEYLSQVESVENIDSSCIAEHLYYRH